MTTIESGALQAQLIRSPRRKSVGIIVRNGKVVVRAPNYVPLDEIQNFIHQKQDWIQKHLSRQEHAQHTQQKNFTNGELHFWLGKRYPLTVNKGRPNFCEVNNQHIEVTCSYPERSHCVQKVLERWYKQQCEALITKRVKTFANQLNVTPSGIAIKHYKTRWGSCNHKKQLQFNWLLIMAPLEVIDYVVIHELCHLKHFNHSPAFWQMVAKVMPNFSEHKQWLNQQTYLTWPKND